jgi:cobalt/nickel transport system permease protein
MHHWDIDRFSQGDSAVHRLDGRAKLLAVLAYTAVVISFGRYELASMAPLLVGPPAMLWAAGVPVRFALRRVLILSPFILVLCLASPFYDAALRTVGIGPWAWQVRGGWLTAGNVALKFTLCLTALTALMATTPFALVLESLRRLGLPAVLVSQLGFLYRYLFVLVDQAMRMRRARDFRDAGRAGGVRRLAAAGNIIGSLLVRTLERSERIYLSMQTRGYRGQPRSLARLRMRPADWTFVAVTAAYLVACRWLYPAVAA